MNNSPNHDLHLRRLIDRVLMSDDIQMASDAELEARLDAAVGESMGDAEVERVLTAVRLRMMESQPLIRRDGQIGSQIEYSTLSTQYSVPSTQHSPVNLRSTGAAAPHSASSPTSRHRNWAFVAVALSFAFVIGALMFDTASPRKSGQTTSSLLNGPTRSDLATNPPPSWTRLTARERSPSPPTVRIAAGSTIITAARERRRVTLPDGSVLYVNERSQVRIESPRRVRLLSGEVFVEVVPQELLDRSVREPFTVETPDRRVTALGTKFAVNASDTATNVLVAQGKVQVSGVDQAVEAGQTLELGSQPVLRVAPRDSESLAWAHELIVAAEAPLVPISPYRGGALVARDPSGQESRLSLRKLHVDVHIEDGFARTTIDQTYFNHQSGRLEGTFYFPLPPDASLSRLAMYVGENLMEGGMVEREYARNVYEQIVYSQRDPALLEWVDGSTFKMRVFPIEGRQEKRVILSYSQRLATAYGRTEYRFPAGHNLNVEREWSSQVRVKGGAGARWSSPSHDLAAKRDGGDLVLVGSSLSAPRETAGVKGTNDTALEPRTASRDVRPSPPTPLPLRGRGESERDLVLELSEHLPPSPPGRGAGGEGLPREAVRLSSFSQDGYRYLMVRFTPDLAGKMTRPKRHWVCLFEASGDRDPVLARTQIEILRTLLQNAEHDDTFSIVTAGTRAARFAAEPLACTQKNIDDAIRQLEQTHLVGALDLAQALEACVKFAPLPKGRQGGAGSELRGQTSEISNDQPTNDQRSTMHILHLGSGIAALGERDEAKLAEFFPQGVTYVGVGVGKRWSRSFMKLAGSRTGGYFTQINPDEKVGWRAFELLATLNAPRLLDVRVNDDRERLTFLNHADSLAQGEELCAVTRLRDDEPLPKSLSIAGRLDGKLFQRTVAVENVAERAGHLPRTWGRLEIDRLLAEGAEKHKPDIITLSKAMYVMSPFTSLLVLESEEMYAQYKVDRGRQDHWAMYPAPAKIAVVYEPFTAPVQSTGVTSRQVENEVLRRQVFERLATLAGATAPMPYGNYWGANLDWGREGGWNWNDWSELEGETDPAKRVYRHHFDMWDQPDMNSNGTLDLYGEMTRYTTRTWSRPSLSTVVPMFDPLQVEFDLSNEVRLKTRVYPVGDLVLQGLGGRLPGGNSVRYRFDTEDDYIRPITLAPLLVNGNMGIDVDYTYPEINNMFLPYQPQRFPIRLTRTNSIPQLNNVVLFTDGVNLPTLLEQGLAKGRPGRININTVRYPDLLAEHVYQVDNDTDGDGVADRIWFDLDFPVVADSGLTPRLVPLFAVRVLDNDVLLQQSRDEVFQLFATREFGDIGVTRERLIEYDGVVASTVFHSGRRNMAQRLRMARADKFLEVLHQVELSGIPFQDEPPIFYPTPEVWQALTERRANWKSVDLGIDPNSPKGKRELRILRELDRTTKMEFVEVPLRDAIASQSEQHEIPIRLDEARLAAEGVKFDQPITLNVDGISLRSGLKLLLQPLGLVYVIEDEMLKITSVVAAREKLSRVTSLHDILVNESAAESLLRRIASGQRRPARSVSIPRWNDLTPVFENLLQHAPGLHTTHEDALAVLEAEVADVPKPERGKIDPAARALIERSRQCGWETVGWVEERDPPVGAVVGLVPRPTLQADGSGLFVIERTGSFGLRERIVCDGQTLWHLYPELGLAAKRSVSRFHRAKWESGLPWLVPSADDLSRGADVRLVDAHTVVVQPRQVERRESSVESANANRPSLILVFDDNARLTERRIIDADGRILWRMTIGPDAVRLIDADGKQVAEQHISRVECPSPDISPDLRNLVVLPMPARTSQHAASANGGAIDLRFSDVDFTQLPEPNALALLAGFVAERNVDRIQQLVGQRFFTNGDRRLGFYALMMSSGNRNLSGHDLPIIFGKTARFAALADHPESPLARYIDQNVRPTNAGETTRFDVVKDNGFVGRLSELRSLLLEWKHNRTGHEAARDEAAAVERVLSRVDPLPNSLAWELLHTVKAKLSHGESTRRVAEALVRFESDPTLATAARVTRIRWLQHAGDVAASRKLLRAWFVDAAAIGAAPVLDSELRVTVRTTVDGAEAWSRLVRESHAKLIADGHDVAAVRLAMDCWSVGDRELAEELRRGVLERFATHDARQSLSPLGGEGLGVRGAPRGATRSTQDQKRANRPSPPAPLPKGERGEAILLAEMCWHFDRSREASPLLERLLNDGRFSQSLTLWRLAAILGDQGSDFRRAAGCREHAIALDIAHSGERINLTAIRDEFGKLFESYRHWAEQSRTDVRQRPDLVRRVLVAADQWRALEAEDSTVCQAAARVLRSLGEKEMAWEYLTTPIADKPGESSAWLPVARLLGEFGDVDRASQAFASAFALEPTNADILWEHANFAEKHYRDTDRRELLLRIVHGEWQPRFQNTQQLARAALAASAP